MKRSLFPTLLALSILITLAVSALAANDTARASVQAPQVEESTGNDSTQSIVGPGGPTQISRGPEIMAPHIYNRVIPLLDEEVVLSTVEDEAMWESEPFSTSQFNRIGLRFSAETEQGGVTCWVCWRYTRDEEFRDGVPIVGLAATVPPFEEPGGRVGEGVEDRREDGLEDLYLQWPYYSLYRPPSDFTEVRGLEAQVRCSVGAPSGDYGRFDFGDDSTRDRRTYPGGLLDGIDLTATLTEVKVLLRRE